MEDDLTQLRNAKKGLTEEDKKALDADIDAKEYEKDELTIAKKKIAATQQSSHKKLEALQSQKAHLETSMRTLRAPTASSSREKVKERLECIFRKLSDDGETAGIGTLMRTCKKDPELPAFLEEMCKKSPKIVKEMEEEGSGIVMLANIRQEGAARRQFHKLFDEVLKLCTNKDGWSKEGFKAYCVENNI